MLKLMGKNIFRILHSKILFIKAYDIHSKNLSILFLFQFTESLRKAQLEKDELTHQYQQYMEQLQHQNQQLTSQVRVCRTCLGDNTHVSFNPSVRIDVRQQSTLTIGTLLAQLL